MLAGKHQSQISAMEQIDFGSWKISTLRRLATAFDLALVVRLESFGRFLPEILPAERAAPERLSYADDPEFMDTAPPPPPAGGSRSRTPARSRPPSAGNGKRRAPARGRPEARSTAAAPGRGGSPPGPRTGHRNPP